MSIGGAEIQESVAVFYDKTRDAWTVCDIDAEHGLQLYDVAEVMRFSHEHEAYNEFFWRLTHREDR